MCSAVLAAIVWKPQIVRVIMAVSIVAASVLVVTYLSPGIAFRFVEHFVDQLPFHSESQYYQTMAPGVLAFMDAPVFGIGPGNLRILCPEVIGGSASYDCHPHPHNYYIQLLGEAGIIGFAMGSFFLGSIIWACAKPALRDRSNVVVATMWIVPFGPAFTKMGCQKQPPKLIIPAEI